MQRYKITVYEDLASFTTVAAESKQEARKIIQSFLDDGSYQDMKQSEQKSDGRIVEIEEIK